jgi:hypothetical protein
MLFLLDCQNSYISIGKEEKPKEDGRYTEKAKWVKRQDEKKVERNESLKDTKSEQQAK